MIKLLLVLVLFFAGCSVSEEQAHSDNPTVENPDTGGTDGGSGEGGTDGGDGSGEGGDGSGEGGDGSGEGGDGSGDDDDDEEVYVDPKSVFENYNVTAIVYNGFSTGTRYYPDFPVGETCTYIYYDDAAYGYGWSESFTSIPNEDNTLLTVYYEDLRWANNDTGYTNRAYYEITKESDAHVDTSLFLLYSANWVTTEGEGIDRQYNSNPDNVTLVYMGDDE